MLGLLALLANANVVLEGVDEIHWLHNSSGQFTVTSYCKETFKGSTQLDFPFWKSKAPTKVCFLAWANNQGRIPTKDMLKRKNFKLASRCSMCFVEEESVDHLSVNCRMVSLNIRSYRKRTVSTYVRVV